MSFAGIRRKIAVGTRVTLTHHSGHGPGDTFRWGNHEMTLPLTRSVAVVQTNAIGFDDERVARGHARLYWPKASEVTVHDERTFTLHSQGRANDMTYRIDD